jgi:hypothetical protein
MIEPQAACGYERDMVSAFKALLRTSMRLTGGRRI